MPRLTGFLSLTLSLAFSTTAYAATTKTAPPTLTVQVTSPATDSSIPQGAQRVPMLNVHLQASCGANIPVSSLTVRHSGLGSTDDIARVYVMAGKQRVSRSVSISKDDRDITFRKVSVPSCKSLDLTLYADIASTADASGEHAFTLVNLDAGKATVKLQQIAKQKTVQVVPSASASSQISIGYRPLYTDIVFGADRIVSRIALTADGRRDHSITAITFKNGGSAADTDVQNLYLATSAGEKVSSTIAHMDGSAVRVTFGDPFLLQSGQTKLLELHADVRASRRKTIGFIIEEPSDVEATEVR